MKIQHVILGITDHLLVVDGIRGPLSTSRIAEHPSGVIAFHTNAYDYTIRAFAGKVYMPLGADAEFELIEDTTCEPAKAAFAEYVEVQKTCTEIKVQRYGKAPDA